METWLGYLRGTPAGYFELARRDGGQVEVAMFGVLPPFIGRGIGGAMLAAAIRRAWEEGTQRVWLHTETSDHPPRPGQLPGARHAGLPDGGPVKEIVKEIRILEEGPYPSSCRQRSWHACNLSQRASHTWS